MVENVIGEIHHQRDQECQESGAIWTLVDQENMLERILFHADVLWLGLDNRHSFAMHRRQVLAAQLYYLDDAPIDEIIELLAPPFGAAWLARSTVEDWLRSQGVICALAYNEIFVSSILDEPPVTIDCVDNLVARLTPELGAEQVGRILGASGLWKRLVFQYHYQENLAPPDICKRLQAAAQRGGCEITDDKLNVWLGKKHLLTRLFLSIAKDSRPSCRAPGDCHTHRSSFAPEAGNRV